MKTIIKRVEDITYEDYKAYCNKNDIDYDQVKMFFYTWRIRHHEYLLTCLIDYIGTDVMVKVTGIIERPDPDGNVWTLPIKSEILPFQRALEKILTPDLTDFTIACDKEKGFYDVCCYHDMSCENIFRVKFI